MSKPMVRIISYPNEIDMPKIREMIDHINSMKASVAKNTTDVAKYSAIQASMPASLTTNDVNWSISQALTKSGTITTTVAKQIDDALKAAGVAVAAPTQALRIPRTQIRMSGPRTDAPKNLTRDDAGTLYYITDFQHLAMFDGYSWWIEPGGYFVDSPTELGLGYAPCDGRETSYLLNDTPNLETMPFTTPRIRSWRRGMRKYFRR